MSASTLTEGVDEETEHDELESRSKPEIDFGNADGGEEEDSEEVKDGAGEDEQVEEVGELVETAHGVSHIGGAF